MREALQAYVKRVGELAEHVRGNEQATKQSLVGPLFTILGYDLTDPRECIPEYRVDFGPNRSVKPIDWAFLQNGHPIFFVEAKEVGKKLASYDEQLADYFAKAPEARLGILTNGVQWRFFTDVVNSNIMDKEPFVKWDVLADEQPPFDFLTLLQKSQFTTLAHPDLRRAQAGAEPARRRAEPTAGAVRRFRQARDRQHRDAADHRQGGRGLEAGAGQRDQRMGAAADADRRPGQPGPVRTAVGRRGGGRRADRDDPGGTRRLRGDPPAASARPGPSPTRIRSPTSRSTWPSATPG